MESNSALVSDVWTIATTTIQGEILHIRSRHRFARTSKHLHSSDKLIKLFRREGEAPLFAGYTS